MNLTSRPPRQPQSRRMISYYLLTKQTCGNIGLSDLCTVYDGQAEAVIRSWETQTGRLMLPSDAKEISVKGPVIQRTMLIIEFDRGNMTEDVLPNNGRPKKLYHKESRR